MQAGRLRHRVTLQRPGGSRDELGERITTWTDVAEVWAAVEPLSGRDQFLAQQTQASTTHRVVVRYSSEISAIDASWRVLFGSRALIIDAPPANLEERNVQIELMCTEGLGQE